MRLMYRHLYKRIQTNKRNTRHVIPHSPSSCFVKHSQTENDEKVSIRFEKIRTWMQTKGEAAAIQSVLFYLPGLHCRGSFEMLAVIPASNEWSRIGSCCLSMFELRLSESCFSKVSAPVDSLQGGSVTGWVLENFPYKKGSLPPTTWWVMQQQKININMTTTDVCFSVDCLFRKQKRSRVICC